jgi:uncharacterized protein Yka (UPF0111/DUF47 family)
LAKSTAESTVKKFSKTGGDSGEYGELLKNTIIDKLNNDDFTKSLEHGLSKIICPLLGNISDKMEEVANRMKSKAISS